jgi:glc operon protein GlcG
MTVVVESRSIALESAQQVVTHAMQTAREQGLHVCVAVVDRAGHLVSFVRMDRAPLLCAQLAQDKAYTVASFGLASHEWWEMIQDDPSLVHGLIKTDRLIVYGGGAPIIHDGELVGGVGVSGGSADQDREIAEAAAQSQARQPEPTGS